MRLAWAFLQIVLPWSVKRRVGKLLFHWDVHPTARVGRSIILADSLTMGPGASIGPFNYFKNLSEVRLGEGAAIGTRNWVSGLRVSAQAFPHSPHRDPSLILGKYAVLASANEIDCADRVEISDFASVAGFGSTILTHSLDLVRDRFVTGPVMIGERSAVMSGCTLLSGTSVPPRSIVSAGSVVNTKLTQELTFYRGNPAEPVRSLPATLKFFHRTGHMGLR